MNLRGLTDYSQPLVAAATVLSFGFVLSVGLGAYAAYKVKLSANIVEVTGSAKESVVADYARLTIGLETKTGFNDQQAGLERLERASENIVKYLEGVGLSEVETPAPVVNTEYTYPERSSPILTGYSVRREIVLRSADVDKVSDVAENVAPLLGPGYTVTTRGIELTYQNLPEMRVKLLSGAIKDAHARAEAIAKETGRSVGALKSATGGVVQVLPQGGVEISDYGSYDTESKNKDVMVTVRASFILN